MRHNICIAGLISLSSGLPYARVPGIFISLLSRLWIIHLSVCLYRLPWLEAHRAVWMHMQVRVHVVTWLSLCFLRLSSRLLTSSNLSLSLFLIISSFFFHFPPSLCFSFGVKVCVSVCMWALSWTMRSALLCWSSWGAPIGGLWMEGLGYPLGFATCPAGTTQAPTSFTQVRR